jgi:tRNA uridine 5-carbamoylmethylation protein Kti12
MTIYITIGFPGSGKSTWARKKAAEEKDLIIINRDSIRSMIKNNYTFDFTLEPMIKCMTIECLKTALNYSKNVIIDETNITKQQRKVWLNIVKNRLCNDTNCCKIIFTWFIENTNNVLYRMNDARGYTESKWQSIINDMKQKFEEPSLDEGVNEIIKIGIMNEKN